jgi:hypothetical protein
MNKKILFSFVVLFLMGISQVFATDISGSANAVAYDQRADGTGYYSYAGYGYNIGQYYSASDKITETSRTNYSFNLSGIPSNATITSVSLSFSMFNYVVSNTYKFNITQGSSSSIPQTIWSGIASSTALFTDVYYASSGSLSNSALTSLVNSNKGGSIYLGAYSSNEVSSNSYGKLSLTLKVTYTTPPTTVSLTIDNNFTASNGTHGTLIVNGSSVNAPYSLSNVTVGTTVTLQAVTNQADAQGYQRVWNTSGVNLSNWQLFNGSYTTKTNSVQYSFTVSSTDQGATYIANLRKLCNITFQNKFINIGNNGTITVNGTQYNSPSSGFSIIEQNQINAVAAIGYLFNGIIYNFQNWTDGNGNYVSSATNTTFNPTTHNTYCDIFICNNYKRISRKQNSKSVISDRTAACRTA